MGSCVALFNLDASLALSPEHHDRSEHGEREGAYSCTIFFCIYDPVEFKIAYSYHVLHTYMTLFNYYIHVFLGHLDASGRYHMHQAVHAFRYFCSSCTYRDNDGPGRGLAAPTKVRTGRPLPQFVGDGRHCAVIHVFTLQWWLMRAAFRRSSATGGD